MSTVMACVRLRERLVYVLCQTQLVFHQLIHRTQRTGRSTPNWERWGGGGGGNPGGERSYGSIKTVALGARGQGHHRSGHHKTDGQKTKRPHGSLVNKVGAEGQRLGGGDLRTHVESYGRVDNTIGQRKEGRTERKDRDLYDEREEMKGGMPREGQLCPGGAEGN